MLAKKLRKEFEARESRNVIDFSFEKMKRENAAAQLQKDGEGIDGVDPLSSAYVFVFRRIVDFANCSLDLPELNKYEKFMTNAHDYLCPSFPPMSPISDSYYNLWSVCDVKLAANDDETFASCFVECLKFVKSSREMIALAECLAHSHMGFFEQIGPARNVFEKSHFQIPVRDLFFGNEFLIGTSSGYAGEVGKIWFGRALPNPFDFFTFAPSHSVLMGTPYVFENSDKHGILSFFERSLEKVKAKTKVASYRRFMKFGLGKRYWPDFIFDAYLNFESGAIFLTGVPDIPLSQPHSRESERSGQWTPLSRMGSAHAAAH